MELVVVVPTYNEAENLEALVAELLALGLDGLRILIVDDQSPDGTGKLADTLVSRHPQTIEVIHRQGKHGLGLAYLDGFRRAPAQ